MVALGTHVESFSLPATGDKHLSLAEFQGKKLLLYFYPKDNTPGCTNEGLAFKGALPHLSSANVAVVGVSRDTLKSHEAFKARYELPFDLIADTEEVLCKQFDVIKEKSMYGRKMMGICRSSFLIDEQGVLLQEWRKVDAEVHCQQVLDFLGIQVTLGPATCHISSSNH